MGSGKLCVRRVRRYRKARYPSRHPQARRGGSPARRVLRAAAGPAVALGLGAAGAACDGGVSLVGEDHDVVDPTDVADSTDATDATDTLEATDETYVPPDDMIAGGRPEGDYYTAYLSEAEGRALIAAAVHEDGSEWVDPCAAPTLAERLTGVPEDRPFEAEGVRADVDLLAPAISVEWTEDCLGGYRPAVGFEFATVERGDDEDVSDDPAGFTDAEEAALPGLRERYEAALALLRATDFPYGVWDYGWYTDDSDRARAEQAVRDAVRVLLDELRRDGFI
ncbi:MAG: hypothetical protein JXB32_00775 [Deltaproteobacteria bacterium]|nr:hypothetical protein [Deltaproteobacteria bacterium]